MPQLGGDLLRAGYIPHRHRARRREQHGSIRERPGRQLGLDQPRVLHVIVRENAQTNGDAKRYGKQEDLARRAHKKMHLAGFFRDLNFHCHFTSIFARPLPTPPIATPSCLTLFPTPLFHTPTQRTDSCSCVPCSRSCEHFSFDRCDPITSNLYDATQTS